jgi:membrane-bound lytic murein transglycosylase D
LVAFWLSLLSAQAAAEGSTPAADIPSAVSPAVSATPPAQLPDFLWSDVPADAPKRGAAASGDSKLNPEAPSEIREPLALPRPVDLTAAPDDIWERIRRGFAMPNLEGPLVNNRQIWYASQKPYLERMVARSRLYLYHIVEEIEKRGMPTEIALLPMVESAFNPMAYSRAHASGLWQFIPSTGKNYKLKQNWWFDERRDIMASTTAALDYLQSLYEMHGDWHLALASYNWGENAVARAIKRNRAKGLPTDYQHLPMPRETRYYLPKLQALKNIILNPAAFDVNLDPIPNQPYFVTVNKDLDIDIRLAAKLAEMPVEELIALNPAYKRPVLAASQTQTLVLPADRVAIFQSNLENHEEPLVSWQTYQFKSGDKLDKLASKHGITLARLKLVNGITPRTRVAPGTQLLLPIKGTTAGIEPLPAVFQTPPPPQPRRNKLVHIVRQGDTLFSIARRYRVSMDDIKRWNKLQSLMTGQRLVVYRSGSSMKKSLRVKSPGIASNERSPEAIHVSAG